MSIFLNFLFLLGIATTIFGNNLKKIDLIKSDVKFIEFDSDSNIYISNGANHLYKLNSKLELLLENNKSGAYKMFETPSSDTWLISGGVSLLKHNSTNLQYRSGYAPTSSDNKCFKPVFLMDKNGKLIHNTAQGVAMLNDEDETPVLIVNLENFYIVENSYWVDPSNNIYLIVTTRNANYYDCDSKLAVIYAQELNSLAPSAVLFNGPNLKLQPSFMTEFDGNLLAAYSGDYARLYKIKKDLISDLEVIYSGPKLDYYNFLKVGNNLYFFGKQQECHLYVVYDGEKSISYKIKRIDKVFDDNVCSKDTEMISDSDGTVFINSNTRLYRLKAGEKEIDDILPFNKSSKPAESYDWSHPYSRTQTKNSVSIAFDQNEDLWILGKGDLFLLKKNSTTAEQITNLSFASDPGVLKISKNSNEIFVGSQQQSKRCYYMSRGCTDDVIKEGGLYVFLQ